jgi:prolyl-tRNA editing enzyme YbaK/EbsC (Cys-tRNA(Pro) deacylase)/predicted enzyme related to lactoylglutathione lyase
VAAVEALGLDYRIVRHGPVRSLEEAAAARGVEPCDVVKTLVVRRGVDDYLLVLVPGDRQLDWPQLRDVLRVSRASLPDACEAFAATGYERGTITPFGSSRAWPVVADERLRGRQVTVGAGAHGVAMAVDADAALAALGATVADVTHSTGPQRRHHMTHEQPHQHTPGLHGWVTHTELASDDPAATQEWCSRVLGWHFRPPMATPAGEYLLFAYSDVGGGGIRGTAPGESPGSTPTVHVDDAHVAYEQALAAGAVAVSPPERVMEGVTVAMVRAPGGVLIGLSGP